MCTLVFVFPFVIKMDKTSFFHLKIFANKNIFLNTRIFFFLEHIQLYPFINRKVFKYSLIMWRWNLGGKLHTHFWMVRVWINFKRQQIYVATLFLFIEDVELYENLIKSSFSVWGKKGEKRLTKQLRQPTYFLYFLGIWMIYKFFL